MADCWVSAIGSIRLGRVTRSFVTLHTCLRNTTTHIASYRSILLHVLDLVYILDAYVMPPGYALAVPHVHTKSK